MKKLALLLGSLLVVGTTVTAKEAVVAPVEVSKEVVVVAEPVAEVVVVEETPLLVPTSFGLWYENDNTSGSANSDLGLNYFGMNLGLKSGSGNWTYGIQAYKAWTLDDKFDIVDGASDDRFQLDAWRHFNRDGAFKYSLGARARLNKNYDRYYLRGKYAYGMFSGWADAFYTANNETSNSRDSHTLEIMPLNMTFGPLTLGYFLAYNEGHGTVLANETMPESYEHQVRFYFPLFSYEKLSLSAEYRLGLARDSKHDKSSEYDFGNRNRGILNVGYAYSENISLNAYYLYDVTRFKKVDNTRKSNENYGEFGFEWSYKF
ncbi:hypothetical protein OQE61_12605 [Cetobacterium somerae]|uniref:FomA family porin-like outer membrane protein n=1 Tax=Cetobacterium somerae TaxID=188913 RepID=UPI00224D0F43|nr:hypothetical protein [Cetobacterium somerae]MCX3068337.1 hypothetical protein [Cetobacterium somerae]